MLLRWSSYKKKTCFGGNAVITGNIIDIKSSAQELKILNLLSTEKCENDTC